MIIVIFYEKDGKKTKVTYRNESEYLEEKLD